MTFSTEDMARRAADAITGLKLRPVRQNRRLPNRSAVCARTSATSPGNARSMM